MHFGIICDCTAACELSFGRAHNGRSGPLHLRFAPIAVVNALEIFGLGYSWAGFESLAVNAQLGDRTVSKRDYGGPVIRLQIGLEDVPDLKADLEKALAAARAA